MEEEAGNNNFRFPDISEEMEAEILDGRTSKNTKRATAQMVKLLSDYITAKPELPYSCLSEVPNDFLPSLMRKFYLEARKSDGELYKLSSLKAIRSGLNRYICTLDFSMNIIFSLIQKVFYSLLYM